MSQLDLTVTANIFGKFELSRDQLQTIQDIDAEYQKELAKLRAGNKALLEAAKGVKKLLEEPSPFYLKKLGGSITNGDQKQIDDVFIALDAAIEHSEPQ